MTLHTPIKSLVTQKKVIICCGAGGVGKTTTAAALALAGAQAGRRVLVLTIDPAKRLAQAMGVSAHMHEPTAVSRERLREVGITEGALDAWMLNSTVVFQSLVRRMAPTLAQAERVLQSRLFIHLSELLAGMQEYTAAEALYDLSTSGRYDLVVLDTPPARNALDFLEAPGKLMRFLDEKILSLFIPSQSKGLFKKATELIGTVFTKVFGGEFFQEIQEFLTLMSGLFGPMRAHAEGVRSLLTSPEAAFLLVTSPDHAALADARYFRERMKALELPFAGFILNRSWVRTDGLHEFSYFTATAHDAPAAAVEKMATLARREQAHIERDRGTLRELLAEVPHGAFATAAPNLGEAIEDLKGLAALAHGLCEETTAGPT